MLEYSLARAPGLEAELTVNLTKKYSAEREGIHVSDLTLCLRKAVARKLDPQPVTDKELGYFLDGARRHQTLQELYGTGVAEMEGEFEGVRYTIDIWDGKVIEFKTTRASKGVSEHWIRQVSFYMVATGTHSAILQVQRINAKRKPFEAFTVALSDRAFEAARDDLRFRRDKVSEAVRKKDLRAAPIYRGDGEWICRECPYKRQCDQIEGRT